jgi:hypothetical protein
MRRKRSTAAGPVDALLDVSIWSLMDDETIKMAHRSCCCVAPPVVRVLLKSRGPSPHSVDILLCGHHYREASPALARVGAMVVDRDGFLLTPEMPVAGAAGSSAEHLGHDAPSLPARA